MNAREMTADKIIEEKLINDHDVWMGPEGRNYWSNLDIDENRKFLDTVRAVGAKEAVNNCFPEHADVIFSPKRAGGLVFLDPRPGEIVIDCGCMWGALTIPLAKAGCRVVAIDQTLESLEFLKHRVAEEGLDNVDLVCAGLNKITYKESSIDKVIVNGVLEWLPESAPVEVKKYLGKKTEGDREERGNPRDTQLSFLRKAHHGLKEGGLLYLAIENRIDLFNFFGIPDPHCGLKFISLMPRRLQDLVSRFFLGRPYSNRTYSPNGLRKLLMSAGFKKVDVLYAFPDYRFPEHIFSSNSMNAYLPFRFHKVKNAFKRGVCRFIEEAAFRWLKLYYFSPSLVALARK